MFDPRSHLRAHAFLNDKPPTTWPEMVRQSRDRDVDPCLYRIHTKSLISMLIAGLSAHFHRWQSKILLRGSQRQLQRKGQDSALEFSAGQKTPTHPGRG